MPDNNYRILIQHIIQYTSDGQQRLESFLRPHVIKCVQGVIEAMSSSSASGCALALVDLQQRLGNRAEWIYGWMVHSVVDITSCTHFIMCSLRKLLKRCRPSELDRMMCWMSMW